MAIDFQSRSIRSAIIIASTLTVIAVLVGCQNGNWRSYEIPHSAVPAPMGTFSKARYALQDERAEVFDFVLYNQNWYQGGNSLGPEGSRRLNHMIMRLAEVPYPIIIEPQAIVVRPDPDHPQGRSSEEAYQEVVAHARAQNEIRREIIVNQLAEAGVPNPQERVIVDYMPKGLFGVESQLVAQQLITGGNAGGGFQGNALGSRGALGRGNTGRGFGGGLGGGLGGFGIGGFR